MKFITCSIFHQMNGVIHMAKEPISGAEELTAAVRPDYENEIANPEN